MAAVLDAHPNTPGTTGAVIPIKTLTPAQTAKLAVKLDSVFDPGTGKYVDGWTDQKVAESSDIPRANVAAFRDEAFGPLKVNPALDKALELLARVESEYAQAKAAQNAMAARLARLETDMRAATDAIARIEG